MLKLLIGWGGNERDYTINLNSKSLQITEQVNIPSQMTFPITPIGRNFVLPPQRAYVRLYSTNYDRTLFTGFISAEPTRNFMAISQLTPVESGGQLFRYDITCTSDEYLLNIKAVPFIPAFVNRYQGDILATIANILCPGFFDTTSQMAKGDLVPYMSVSPVRWRRNNST